MPLHVGYDYKIDQPSRGPSIPASPISLTGLQSYWRMEEASGNRIDRMGVADFVPNLTSPGRVAGKIDFAVNIQLANEIMRTAANYPTPTTDFTWACWVNVPTGSLVGGPIDQSVVWTANGISMFWSSFSNDIRFTIQNVGGGGEAVCLRPDGGGGFPFDTWHLWVGTYRLADGKVRFYFDNEAVIVSTVSVVLTGLTAQKLACGTIQALVNAEPVQVDELTVWTREWSAAEVLTYWSGGAGINLNNYIP